jgi:hypothetical protein
MRGSTTRVTYPEGMNAKIEEMPPTRRPDDPFVREMGDAVYRIEGNYVREGSRRGSRFEGQLLSDAQAEYVIRKTRWHDSVTRYQVVPTSTTYGPAERDYEVRIEGEQDTVIATFSATPSSAATIASFLGRGAS